MKLDQAYPDITFRRRTTNWWARLTRVPAECVHLETDATWAATFIPDLLYLRGKTSTRRQPARPEVSICRVCLERELERELSQFKGRIVAFEPDRDTFSQYFFVGTAEFSAAGLQEDTAAAIGRRLEQPFGDCELCERAALWLWMSREQVPSLDEATRISLGRGEALCAAHGAKKLSRTFAEIKEANLFYVNVPYGESGAYVWI